MPVGAEYRESPITRTRTMATESSLICGDGDALQPDVPEFVSTPKKLGKAQNDQE